MSSAGCPTVCDAGAPPGGAGMAARSASPSRDPCSNLTKQKMSVTRHQHHQHVSRVHRGIQIVRGVYRAGRQAHHAASRIQKWWRGRNKVHNPHTPRTTPSAAVSLNDLHSGVTSVNRHYVVNPVPPKGCIRHAPIHVDEVYQIPPSVASEGFQGVQMLTEVGSAIPWMCTPTTAGINTSQVNYFDLNPYGRIQAGQIFPTLERPSMSKMYLNHANVAITVKNFSNVAVYVDLYCVQAKKKIERSPDPTNASLYIDTFPSDIWAQSLVNESVGISNPIGPTTIGAETIDFPYARPTSSKGWNSYFHVRGVHHINLAAGAEEQVSYNLTMNLPFDGQKLLIDNAKIDAIRGGISGIKTHCRFDLIRGGIAFMAITRGALGKDVGGNVIITSPEVGYLVKRKQNFGLMKSTNQEVATVLGQRNLPVASGDVSIINAIDNIQKVQNV